MAYGIDERVEGVLVKLKMNALAGVEFVGFVFALAALGPAAGFRFGGEAAKLFHAVVMLGLRSRGGLFLSQAALPGMKVPRRRKCARRGAWRATRCRGGARRREAVPRRLRRADWV